MVKGLDGVSRGNAKGGLVAKLHIAVLSVCGPKVKAILATTKGSGLGG